MSLSAKNLSVGVVIGLVVGLALGYSISLIGNAGLKQQISELESQVASLENAIGIKDTDIASLESQISNLESQVDTLESQLANLGGQIDSKNVEISELESEIREKDTAIAQLHSQISGLEQQLGMEVLGVFFSPKGGCENEVLYWISRANESIHILIYSFTLDSIGDALLEARDRGIEVRVVFEEDRISQYSEYQKLKDAGITVRIDTNSRSMHHKVLIVDGILVLTSSFNWSDNGENYNNENLIVIESSYVATIYEGEFTEIWDVSQPPQG